LKKEISNWNNYPKVLAEIIEPVTTDEIIATTQKSGSQIARGAGKSYGDASLYDTVLSTSKYNSILNFDLEDQSITVESGILLDSILRYIVPYNLFLYVVPGTKFISVGGAIAADIHGKNHVSRGSFSEYVMEMTVLNAKGEMVETSREKNQSLFYNTFGAMGLTGIVLTAKIKLKTICTNK
jgi:FAD/FMN-containing dehydrogenase